MAAPSGVAYLSTVASNGRKTSFTAMEHNANQDRITVESQEWHAPTVAAQDKDSFIANAHPEYYIKKEPYREEILGTVWDKATAHMAAKSDAPKKPAPKAPRRPATKKK